MWKYFSLLVLLACSHQRPPLETTEKSFWTLTAGLSHTRGGTTQGEKLTLTQATPESWKKLKVAKLSAKERDRRAILHLAGEYRTTFEFLETIKFIESEKAHLPYRSWGTELVFVIEESEDFISLQHIMVMRFVDPKTKEVSPPYVMKHWRQDWRWQAGERFEYQGRGMFRKLKASQSQGQWLWSVYQVDDSPRYFAQGRWQHHEHSSHFVMNEVARPLPRRESEVRSDYDILRGEERLIITERHWYHEQANFKQKLNENNGDHLYLAREIGHNSYQRIEGFDFTPATEYWQHSGTFWKEVRGIWQQTFKESSQFHFKEVHEGAPLFALLFDKAQDENFVKKLKEDPASSRLELQKMIAPYVSVKK
jgi:hypothetical protein